MASRDSSTRSAARATSSALSGAGAAYRRLPIRWRLAGGSAALTFVILCGFAVIVGLLTTRQIRIQFDDSVRDTADVLQQHAIQRKDVSFDPSTGVPRCGRLADLAAGEAAKLRVYYEQSGDLLCAFGGAHPREPQFSVGAAFPQEQYGYRLEARRIPVDPVGTGILLYARPLSAIDRTAAKVRFFLLLGVVGGTGLALLAGVMVARRAMAPIAELTASAREIERTRDPGRRVPQPEADDEVGTLATTLEEMLEALDAARDETEAALQRQREFVADASHELRTPLTSVLANLELLAEHVRDEDAREAVASALRSSQRMRRLVADLLLLARADAGRSVPHRPVDLAQVLVEVAAELEPVTGEHHLTVSAHEPAVVDGARDELHRLALNLIENALRHTPAGTHVHAALVRVGDEVVLTVEDDGPGIPDELRARLFERFVRGRGDSGGGSGLGLSIVRAVAISHGGAVVVERPSGRGARFVVRLPRAASTAPALSEPVSRA
ncbi:MAG TPA: HAMP domain-containing sensor histidine kinase [Conexibacter sp.]|nr:HAMP domain-containing sensor histidine kinase [Conexibacter sp.]